MSKYIHRVNYYETDKMGITHHSNYMRFMEEARMNFLSEIGYPMTRLEKEGITSPVVSVNCEYKHTTTYSVFVIYNEKFKHQRDCGDCIFNTLFY